MPGFLKSIFKSSQSRRQAPPLAGPLPPGVQFSAPSSPIDHLPDPEDDIAQLARVLRDRLKGDEHDSRSLVEALWRQHNGDPREMARVMAALKIVAEEDGRVSPYPSTESAQEGQTSIMADGKGKTRHMTDSRLSLSAAATPIASAEVTPWQSPLVSPAGSRSVSPDPNFHSISSASHLEQMYGTGPMPSTALPSSSSQAPGTPRPPPSPTDTEVSQEIWEYRGNLLTRSALSLVMRQEALAQADSSGQYAGEVSWDDVRNAWIPKWAVKMRPEDLADGELANPNPAEFKVKREDAWGNKIGWRDGIMYYKEEPTFDNVPD